MNNNSYFKSIPKLRNKQTSYTDKEERTSSIQSEENYTELVSCEQRPNIDTYIDVSVHVRVIGHRLHTAHQ